MVFENKNKAICVVPDYIPDAPQPQLTEVERFVNFLEVRDRETHHNLRSDLVEHIWPLDITDMGVPSLFPAAFYRPHTVVFPSVKEWYRSPTSTIKDGLSEEIREGRRKKEGERYNAGKKPGGLNMTDDGMRTPEGGAGMRMPVRG
ncbi:hypothetical protein OSB04_015022 [Centaurea solstitialis]|uniref:Uncharacterized protein n=1 Tax=Centaurea solstitialis TaxID=347529 RepID=A0AA38TGG4_9ASTR|nr:hypothetical protein OSB04_015022 [Centaurea solstitialis]